MINLSAGNDKVTHSFSYCCRYFDRQGMKILTREEGEIYFKSFRNNDVFYYWIYFIL